MGINRRDLILTAIGVGVVVLIALALTIVTLWGGAGALTFS